MSNKKFTVRNLTLGLQHLFAMCGATIVVPLITGLSVPVALFSAGIGTLIFHLITKGKVPVFLGSSFAFIGVVLMVSNTYGSEYAMGGIVVAGLTYLLFALLVKTIGLQKIKKLFPPIITGTIIIIIGLTLAPGVVSSNIINATQGTLGQRWIIALITVATMISINLFSKGFFKSISILFGFIAGYLSSLAFGIVDIGAITSTPWFQIPSFTLPLFNLQSIIAICSVTIVTFMEHIGDITMTSAVTGQDFIENPGLHRTLIGDGVATSIAGLIGGPANTTYSENVGVLTLTKNYNPFTLRLAAIFSIILAFIGKLGIILQTIPSAVIGGASILLFGMISATGLRVIKESDTDLNRNKNLIIISIMLICGISGIQIPITETIVLEGLALAAISGILLNQILPDN